MFGIIANTEQMFLLHYSNLLVFGNASGIKRLDMKESNVRKLQPDKHTDSEIRDY